MWMASRSATPQSASVVQEYRMHVSQKYIDLTRQKLRLTRLPRDPAHNIQYWDSGATKAQIEPLVDEWLERYDWRQREAFYNDSLPQYRVVLNGTRIHYVHRKSAKTNGIPLLFVHGWPESFLSVAKIIDQLSEPDTASVQGGADNVLSFDVVAPSLPGCGFSDTLQEEHNNAQVTADVLNALMLRLGYLSYFAHGSGWGFTVCRLLALRHSDSCIAVHTINPTVPSPATQSPQLRMQSPQGTLSTGLADLSIQTQGISPPLTPRTARMPPPRPQTDAYALCDSPVGLLALVLDKIKAPPPRQRSPQRPSMSRQASADDPWTSEAVLDWTMIHWLPGPEAGLRWLVNTAPLESTLWTVFSNVPLGITIYNEPGAPPGATGLQNVAVWAGAYHPVVMMRPRSGSVRFAAWERPDDVVADIRELARMLGQGSQPTWPAVSVAMTTC